MHMAAIAKVVGLALLVDAEDGKTTVLSQERAAELGYAPTCRCS